MSKIGYKIQHKLSTQEIHKRDNINHESLYTSPLLLLGKKKGTQTIQNF